MTHRSPLPAYLLLVLAILACALPGTSVAAGRDRPHCGGANRRSPYSDRGC